VRKRAATTTVNQTPPDPPNFRHPIPSLHEDYQKLTFYLEHSPLAAIEWDCHLRVQRWSARAEELFGWSADEATHRCWWEWKFVFEADLQKVNAAAAALQSGREFYNICRNRNYTKTGLVLSCEWYNSAFFDAEGRLLSILSLVQDVSDREQALAQLAEAQRLAHLGSWEYDLFHQTFTWSAQMCCILGFDPVQPLPPLQEHPALFYGQDWQKVEAASQRAIAMRQPQALEFRIIRTDGSLRYLEGKIEAVFNVNGEAIKLVGTALDISDRATTQRALQASEKRLRALFEQAGVGIAEVGLCGEFLRVNQRLCDFLGYSQAELLNLTFQEITYADDAHLDVTCKRRFEAGELSTYTYEKRYIRKDGQVRWAKVTISLMDNEDGSPQSVIGVIEDIHDHKLAQEALKASEERFQEIVATLDRFFFVRSAQSGEYLYLSPAYEKIWQRSRASLYANPRSWLELVHPEDRESVLASLRQQDGGQPAYREYRIIRGQGEIRWIRAHSSIILDDRGQPLRIIGIAEDITAEALQRQELARSNAELEQFAYIASHDLQAPLGIISSYAQLLQQLYQNQLDERAHKLIDNLVRGTVRMQRLIEDLLEYSRLGQEAEPFQLCNCQEIVADAIANLELLISTHNASIIYQNLPNARGSRSQLIQLFQNLIANSIKYCRRDRTPQITITAEKQGHLYQFAVRDNGIGIDPEYQDRIFKIFQRLHNQQEYSGSGIGLAICQKIVERHGGRIWVKSQPGQGSTFYFTLA
jgi:PAS domain S-box-containing protein